MTSDLFAGETHITAFVLVHFITMTLINVQNILATENLYFKYHLSQLFYYYPQVYFALNLMREVNSLLYVVSAVDSETAQ